MLSIESDPMLFLNYFEYEILYEFIDFSDMNIAYAVNDEIENDLKNILSEFTFSEKQIVGLYLLAAGRLQFLIDWFLGYTCFQNISELKGFYPFAVNCFFQDKKIPGDTIIHCFNLIEYSTHLVGDHYEENSECSYKTFLELQQNWIAELKVMSEFDQTVANLGYALFELISHCVGFLGNYFSETKKIVTFNDCIDQYIYLIQEILTSLLWTFVSDMIELTRESTVMTRIVDEINRIKEDIYFIKQDPSESVFRQNIDRCVTQNILLK